MLSKANQKPLHKPVLTMSRKSLLYNALSIVVDRRTARRKSLILA